jgi:hypothetical protein
MSKNTSVRHGEIVLWQDMKSRKKIFIITHRGCGGDGRWRIEDGEAGKPADY